MSKETRVFSSGNFLLPIGIRRLEERLQENLRSYGSQGATHRIPAVNQTKVVRAIGEFQNRRRSFGDYGPLKAEIAIGSELFNTGSFQEGRPELYGRRSDL